jgi:DNA-binding transcriptional ArsR family regulator
MMHPFELLATPIRRRIIEVLAVGEHTSGELSDAVGSDFQVTTQAVAYHLRMLRDNDVVRVTVDETTRIYRLNPDALDQLDEQVAQLFDLWDHRYGWRYKTDPLRPVEPDVRRNHRVHGDGYRRRRQAGPDPRIGDAYDDLWRGG